MFKFIDLFAGIGGLRMPFDELKGMCVFSSEIDKFSCQSYESNYDHYPDGDITKIPPQKIPDHDLLLAGFPCQPFSQAGLKKGFDDTRGTLFFYIANILEHHRPKVVLLENVKRFKTHDNCNTYNTVKLLLEQLGYTVSSKVLNAKDFGVPQNRERIYIVGLLNEPNQFMFPTPPYIAVKVGDILDSRADKNRYTISDRLWAGHQRRKAEHKAKGFGFGYSIFNEDSNYTSTISARYYKDGSEILIEQKGRNPRKITPREAARLQGFPDSFKIEVSDTQAYRQFGNSVAVPVIRAIAQELKPYLKTQNSQANIKRMSIEQLINVDGVLLPA